MPNQGKRQHGGLCWIRDRRDDHEFLGSRTRRGGHRLDGRGPRWPEPECYPAQLRHRRCGWSATAACQAAWSVTTPARSSTATQLVRTQGGVNSTVGGFIGLNNGPVSDSYSSGAVESGSGNAVGGLIGTDLGTADLYRHLFRHHNQRPKPRRGQRHRLPGRHGTHDRAVPGRATERSGHGYLGAEPDYQRRATISDRKPAAAMK